MTGLRAGLLSTLREAAEQERPLYARIADPAVDAGGWTLKDHVAHLAAWRREAVEMLEAARRGESGTSIADLDAHNAEIFGRHHDQPADHVVAEAEDSYAALARTLESCPEETLLASRSEDRGPVWLLVAGDGYEHVADHLAMLALQRGDRDAADAAAVWAQRAGMTLPGNAARADYNLGCYFARGGRVEEALPYLQRAIATDAALREWAKSDPDLEGMRELVTA